MRLYFKYKEFLWFVVDWVGSISHVTFTNPLGLLPTFATQPKKNIAKHKSEVPQSVISSKKDALVRRERVFEIFQKLAITPEISADNTKRKGFLERHFVRSKFPEKYIH